MGRPKYIRPQKHNSWFNVMPVRDFARLKSSRVPFLDSFVTVEAAPDEAGYVVRYEGVHPMQVTVQYGFICAWFGDDLNEPSWPYTVQVSAPGRSPPTEGSRHSSSSRSPRSGTTTSGSTSPRASMKRPCHRGSERYFA